MTIPCQGGCLCGGVRFAGRLESDAVVACHCRQCRASSGHYWASAHLLTEGLVLTGQSLRWYESSPGIERGFCSVCGAFLFWRRAGAAYIAVSAGALEDPPPLRTAAHIFTASAGGYYRIPEDAPHFPRWPPPAGAAP
jgi:hypothetical protein